MGKVFGIDLGTTYSCIAYIDENGKPVVLKNAEGDLTTPSAVFFETQTDVTVGSAAKESAKMYPEQVVTFIKRSIGQPGFSLNLNGIDMKPEEISSYILKKVVKDAEDTLRMEGKSDGLYADSNGKIGSNHRYFRESHKQLARAQRKLSRRVGSAKKECKSHNYIKQLARVNRIHRRIANQRLDNLHKISAMLARQYDIVCVEDLNMKSLSNKGFGNGKSTMDNGYGMFLVMLKYKLERKGGYLVKVSKWYPSSQLCSVCGKKHPEMKIVKRNPKQGYLVCDCGNRMQTDSNAAKNILSEGLRILTS